MASVFYCAREQVKAALDVAETARNDAQVDRAIEAATDAIYGLTHRRFYPQLATRYFDWPNHQYARPWRLWLDADEVISVSSLVAGGVVIPASDYFLEPANSGPPYTRIEIDLASSSAFAPGATHQRAIAVTGLFGSTADEDQVGDLTASLAASEGAASSATWSTARIGVGAILRIDSERMIVTAKTMVDSTQNLGNTLTAASSDVTVQVTNGAAFAVEEILGIDSERMLIVDKAGNNLTVKRAWDGTVLAAHSIGADVYTLTGVELDRGELGTTIAAHDSGADIFRHRVPALIRDLAVAEAINQLQQETAGYARVIGEGEAAREGTGRGLFDLRRDALARYGRQARSRAV
jgi:hypothetical protein